MARLSKGVLVPANVRAKKTVNANSNKREDSRTFSRLDGLLKSKTPRICIYRRLGGIGDVLMTTPILKHIKHLMPHCHLVYATDLEYSNKALADIIHGNPFVDELMDYKEAFPRDFDFFSDVTATGLKYERKGEIPKNRIDLFADQIGIDISSDPVPDYVVPKEDSLWAKEFIESSFSNKEKDSVIVGIQIKSNDHRRTWAFNKNVQLIKLLIQDPKYKILSFHWENQNFINLPGVVSCDFNFKQTAALVDECDVIVCPDSAVLHIAGTLGKKTVSIFGPIPPESRIGYYNNTVALTAGGTCHCWYSPSCRGKQDCLERISPDRVYQAVLDKLQEKELKREVALVLNSTVSKPNNAVLVVRHFGGFGDIIQTVTAIEALAKKYPGKEICYAIPKKFWPAAENNPIISKLLDADTSIKKAQYSIVADISTRCAHYEVSRIQRKQKVTKTRIETFIEALGVERFVTKTTGSYYVSEEEQAWAKEFLPETRKPRLAIAMRCAEEYRNWPQKKYNELIPLLVDRFQVIILDSIREFSYNNTVDACGFSFRKAGAVINECDLVLTPDTGILHLAAALEKEIITMFGPIDSQARCRGHKNTKVLTAKKPCIPCWRNSIIPCKQTGSAKGYSKCMQELTVKDVYKTLVSGKTR